MRALIQRVKKGIVEVDNKVISNINQGIVLFIGIENSDDENDINWISQKVSQLRIFDDENGALNQSISDIDGDILLVPNFTLAADTSRGNRPGFSTAMPPTDAKVMFEKFVDDVSSLHTKVSSGLFGADMQVSLINDGPITISLASKK